MNKTNIELARECQLLDGLAVVPSQVDRYTAAVEARLMANLLEGAGEPLNRDDTVHGVNYYTADQIAAAVLREREECAKVCDAHYNHEAKDCAEEIRNRGTK